MVNLLSNDVNRFDLSVIFNHHIWCGPLQLTIVTTLLYQKIGPSALVGAILLIAAVPLQSEHFNYIIFFYKDLYLHSLGGQTVRQAEGQNCREDRQADQVDE